MVLVSATLLLVGVFAVSLLSEGGLDELAVVYVVPAMLFGLELGVLGGAGGAALAVVLLLAASARHSELEVLGLAASSASFLIGALTFLVAIPCALTGYVSQPNFDSQWISTQAKDAMNAVGVGAFFNLLDFGQMYSWHILLLPAAVVAIVIAHVLLVRKHGVVPPFVLEHHASTAAAQPAGETPVAAEPAAGETSVAEPAAGETSVAEPAAGETSVAEPAGGGGSSG